MDGRHIVEKRVLVTATNFSKYCSEAKALLEREGFSLIENTAGSPLTFDEIRDIITDIDAVIAGVDTWNGSVFKLAPRLRVIARFGVGVDNIDLQEAEEHDIVVTNAKGMNANAVAELTVGLVLGALRRIPYLDGSLRKGCWDRFMGAELSGKRVGFLGFGTIAQLVAKKLQSFDVELCAFDPYPDFNSAHRWNVKMIGFEDLLKTCDVLSLHLPSLRETCHIMGRAQFAMMKEGACLINTARGALVDEAALCQALKTGRLRAAAVDVYEKEPAEAENPLFALENVICTPHTAGETLEAYHTISLANARAVIDVFCGRKPQNCLTNCVIKTK